MASMTWGDFRGMVRITLLQDSVPDEEDDAYKWTDEELAVAMRWALNDFAAHTALPSSVNFPASSSLALPDDIYDGDLLDQVLTVILNEGGEARYLLPVTSTQGISEVDGSGFYCWPNDTLNLTFEPDPAATITIRYYRYWPYPESDDDLIPTPEWALAALSYLVAAHALAGRSMKSASIRQWGAKPDTGHPEHNPLQKQMDWFLCLYERELKKRPSQNRIKPRVL